MIFTTWKFGPYDTILRMRGTDIIFEHAAEIGRKSARKYAADIFNWCAAKRDYPYADHPMPAIPWPLHWCAAVEIQQNCEREFNRSNEIKRA